MISSPNTGVERRINSLIKSPQTSLLMKQKRNEQEDETRSIDVRPVDNILLNTELNIARTKSKKRREKLSSISNPSKLTTQQERVNNFCHIPIIPSNNNLTSRQLKLVDEIRNVLLGGRQSFYLVDSPGGTGKTHVIRTILDLYPHNVIVGCPTRKATKLYDKDHGKIVSIQTALGYTLGYTEEGEKIFDNPDIDKVGDPNVILIVDEASMIPHYIYEDILKTRFRAVFFIGDSKQLPPVDDDDDVNFSIFNIESRKLTFNKVFRTNKEYILDVSQTYRDGHMYKRKKINIITITKLYKEDPKKTILLCWKNKTVKEMTTKIRTAIYGKDVARYNIGEDLVFGDFRDTRQFNETHCIGGEYYKYFKKLRKQLTKMDFVEPFYSPSYYCSDMIEIERVEFDYSIILPNNKIVVYDIIKDTCNTTWMIPLKEYEHIVDSYLEEIKEEIGIKQQKWLLYYTFVLIFRPALTFKYAMTVHKSQGSQYKTVIVHNDTEKAKDITLPLCYTAVSRAEENLYFC